ncbi:unnamed protein product, partial [Mesorhabditis belari]|uniref:C6 domain-containing protein n=1 Tax=Mesorhabditis belari TaxID=2138241 RepID=A0AAF3FMB1_9BILA
MYFYHIFLIQFFHRLEAIVTICPSTVFTTQQILTGITTLSTRIPSTSVTFPTTVITTPTTTLLTTTSLSACAFCDQADITIDLNTSGFAVPFSNDSTMLVNGCLVRTFTCSSVSQNGVVIISVNGAQPQDSDVVDGIGSISIQLTCDEDSQWEYLADPNVPTSMFVVTTVMCEDLQ